MVLHVYCVISGGIPILYRTSAEGHKLSFSELAPLNGIQVFGKVHSVTFQSAEGRDFNVYWKNCTEKVSLVLVSRFSVCSNGEQILKLIFDALVFTVGIDELTNVKHVDRLKKEIRPACPLIDEILRSVDEYSDNTETSNLLGLVHTFPFTNPSVLQEKLEEWSEIISSSFCCITFNKKLIVATSAWWDLNSTERSLLSMLMANHDKYTTIDIPVFLPMKSPKVAFRLVCRRLFNDVWVGALCGPTPIISEFEQCATIYWESAFEILNVDLSFVLPTLPDNLNTQSGVQGALLINYELGTYALFGSIIDDKYSFDALRIFYYQHIKELLEDDVENEGQKIRESYWYTEKNKLYAIFSKPFVLCVMTNTNIPIPSVRCISKEMMDFVMSKYFLC